MAWKKKYLLQGFHTRDEAQKRNREFALKNGIPEDATTKYMFAVEPLFQEHWGLIVPEENLNLLEPWEKNSGRLVEIFPPQPMVNAYIPMVFRYLEHQWVDEFFNEGKLKLSSFNKFHQHKDEQRGDKSEGNSFIVGNSSNLSMYSVVSHGRDAFVLSTSLAYTDGLKKDFNVNDCFVIENPLAFANAIASKVPEYKGLLFGPCLYQENKIIKRTVPAFDMESLKNEDTEDGLDFNKMMALSNLAGGNDVFFAKTIKHIHQHEYRFLWFVWMDEVPEFIDIVCPEAISYCKRIE